MPSNTDPKKPQMTTERRMMLAFVLMMLTLVVSQYVFKPAPGPKTVLPTNKAKTEGAAKPATPSPSEGAVTSREPSSGAVQASSEELTTIDTKVYHVVLSNRGGVVKSWALKNYKETGTGQQQNLVNTAAKDVPLPLSIDTGDAKMPVEINQALFVPTVADDGLGVDYRFTKGNLTVRKSVHFTSESYLSDVQSQVVLNGTPLNHWLSWRGGFGDQRVHGAAANQRTVHFDGGENKLIAKTVKDAKDGPLNEMGNYTFGGLEDKFFAAVAMPVGASSLQLRTYTDDVSIPNESKPVAHVGGGFASGADNHLSLFVGPKDINILREVNPKLTQLVDWGFFGVLAKPLFLSLNWVHDHWTNNFGWAIIVVTVIINLLLFPFKLSSLKSARRMQSLQPRIQAINAKYKEISMRDPRKAEQNQEMMALYKEAGVNPLGGCLPLLLQLPFFYAFYQVLNIAIQLRGAPWLWVPDLSQAEMLAIHILPLILIATQFFSQKLTPASGVDPNQQRMMLLMPVMFGFMFYSASAGLVLYWLTSNLVGIGQQLVINRFMPVPVAATPALKAPVKRAGKK